MNERIFSSRRHCSDCVSANNADRRGYYEENIVVWHGGGADAEPAGGLRRRGKELTAEEKRQEAALISGTAQSGNLQEGAQVETSRDARGNVQFSYSNPDGSGGGGIYAIGELLV
jgi:hypothetical protein